MNSSAGKPACPVVTTAPSSSRTTALPGLHIIKGVKRAMAGEYSRELSAKVFAGQCRLIELGFRPRWSGRLRLRRVLIDQHGQQNRAHAR